MKTIKPITAISSALLVISITAFTTAARADDIGRWYLGAGVGQSNAVNLNNIDGTLSNFGLTSSSGIGNNNTAWKLFLGYRMNDYFGFEGAYANLGQFNINSSIAAPAAGTGAGTWTANNVMSVAAVGYLPIQNSLSAFGKLGVAYSTVNFTYAGAGVGVSANNSSFSPLMGVGLKYDLTGNTAVRGELERYQNLGDSSITGQSSINVWSLGLQYKF